MDNAVYLGDLPFCQTSHAKVSFIMIICSANWKFTISLSISSVGKMKWKYLFDIFPLKTQAKQDNRCTGTLHLTHYYIVAVLKTFSAAVSFFFSTFSRRNMSWKKKRIAIEQKNIDLAMSEVCTRCVTDNKFIIILKMIINSACGTAYLYFDTLWSTPGFELFAGLQVTVFITCKEIRNISAHYYRYNTVITRWY